MQKRQHPGKREDASEESIELQRRQHPGKRLILDQFSENPAALLNELSKRQHPGKRYLMTFSKRQHPGRREIDESELDTGDFLDLENRQYSGKKYLDGTIPDISVSGGPCDVQDPATCGKASLLLELLDNVSKPHLEEKRQHPGKRLAIEDDVTEQE